MGYTPLVIGRTYLLPSVLRNFNSEECWFGVLHEHVGDISGQLHIHLDTRFIPDKMFESLHIADKHDILASDVRDYDYIAGEFCKVPLKCYRNWDSSFQPFHTPKWHVLQKMLHGQKMSCDVCPHMKMDLSEVKPVMVKGQLCKICPNHKIAWSIEDGSLVTNDK